MYYKYLVTKWIHSFIIRKDLYVLEAWGKDSSKELEVENKNEKKEGCGWKLAFSKNPAVPGALHTFLFNMHNKTCKALTLSRWENWNTEKLNSCKW